MKPENYIIYCSYQEFEQPEAWLVVARLKGVDQEDKEEAIESQRVSLHWYMDALTEEAGQQAYAPQNPQQTSNLRTHTQAGKFSVTIFIRIYDHPYGRVLKERWMIRVVEKNYRN